jgi:hypothetical protein
MARSFSTPAWSTIQVRPNDRATSPASITDVAAKRPISRDHRNSELVLFCVRPVPPRAEFPLCTLRAEDPDRSRFELVVCEEGAPTAFAGVGRGRALGAEEVVRHARTLAVTRALLNGLSARPRAGVRLGLHSLCPSFEAQRLVGAETSPSGCRTSTAAGADSGSATPVAVRAYRQKAQPDTPNGSSMRQSGS